MSGDGPFKTLRPNQLPYDKQQKVLRPFMDAYKNVEVNVRIKNKPDDHTAVREIGPYEEDWAQKNVSNN